MKKNIILSILFFAAGFLTHAFAFPDFLANGITDIQQIAVPNTAPTGGTANENDPLFTKVTFDGETFSRHNVTIGFTRYIQIINENEKELMWLSSNTSDLATTRGYAYKEAVTKQFNQKGQFVVVNKNNPNEKLIITVK